VRLYGGDPGRVMTPAECVVLPPDLPPDVTALLLERVRLAYVQGMLELADRSSKRFQMTPPLLSMTLTPTSSYLSFVSVTAKASRPRYYTYAGSEPEHDSGQVRFMAGLLRDLAEGRGPWHRFVTTHPHYASCWAAGLALHAKGWRAWVAGNDHAVVVDPAVKDPDGRLQRAASVALRPLQQQLRLFTCPF
jgi:hypothetical protein